jgi:dCTP deaminase
MILTDIEIRNFCTLKLYMPDGKPMIDPFVEDWWKDWPGPVEEGSISYGLSAAGYDLRLSPELLVFKNTSSLVIDPKAFKSGGKEYEAKVFESITMDKWFDLPPHSYALVRSYEYIRIPSLLKARCVGKSTYARCGVLVNTTPLEPGWEGHLTIEIGNVSPAPARIYAMQGIAQLEFERLSFAPERDYAKRGAKYQGQTGITPARA